MKVVGYVRVSTPTQAATGEGLNVQRELISGFVKNKGWTLHHVYVDEGISGLKSENRPALQELLQDAKNKDFETVIVSRLSRFGRNARDILNNIHVLQQSEVNFVSVKEAIEFSTSYGRAMNTVFAAMAELEREIIAEQMSEGKMTKWRGNRMFNGKPPCGYHWNEKINQIEINEEEKKIYEKIVDLYLNYRMSMKDIGIKLKEEGIICKKRPFTSSTISYILKNPAYYGNYIVNQHKYKDGRRTKEKKDASEHIRFKIPAIISRDRWEKIQEKTQFNKFKGKRITRASDHWLRDMIFCGECGGRVKPRFGSKRKDGSAPSYYCCHWSKTSKKDLMASGKEKCSLPHIPTEVVEDRIWNIMIFTLARKREKYFNEHYAQINYESLLKDKTKQCEKIENEIAKQNRTKENLYALLQEQSFNKDEFISRLNIVQERISQLEQDYKDRQGEIKDAKEMTKKINELKSYDTRKNRTKMYRDLWKLSIDDRKRLAENLFGGISLYKSEKDPDGYKVKLHKYGPATILDQFINEGKLPSLDLNSHNDSPRPDP